MGTNFPAEDFIFIAAEDNLTAWRISPPSHITMQNSEYEFASYAFTKLQNAYNGLVTSIRSDITKTTPAHLNFIKTFLTSLILLPILNSDIRAVGRAQLKIYNTRGQEIRSLLDAQYEASSYELLCTFLKASEYAEHGQM